MKENDKRIRGEWVVSKLSHHIDMHSCMETTGRIIGVLL